MNKYMISFFNYKKAFAVPITFAVVEAENEKEAELSVMDLADYFMKQNGKEISLNVRKLSIEEYRRLIDLADEIENG